MANIVCKEFFLQIELKKNVTETVVSVTKIFCMDTRYLRPTFYAKSFVLFFN